MQTMEAEADTVQNNETNAAAVSSTNDELPPPTLSKRAQKKLLKQQKFEAKKAEKKAAMKEQKKIEVERKRKEWDEKLAALSEDERSKLIESRKEMRKERMDKRSEERGKKIERLTNAKLHGQNIVIDLEFSHLMSPNEIHSLVQQVMYCYAINGRCSIPGHLWLTGCEGEMGKQLQRLPGFDKWIIDKDTRPYIDTFQDQKENLVYLTADSETMLDELDPRKIYIVGGLVDRNRWKGITMKKAEEQMIQTAKLPIGTFVKMSGSQVLTVNQVIEILLKYVETRDWKTSFFQMIPQRKRFEASASTAADDDNSEERHEDMQENETYYQQQKFEAKKAEKKAAMKEHKKREVERKRKEWDEKLAALSEDERSKLIESRKETWKERMEKRSEERGKKIERLTNAKLHGQNIVIDLEFSHFMSPNEIHSLVQQIIYCYAINGRCRIPGHLWLTGCEGEMGKQLQRLPGFDKWIIDKDTRPYIDTFQDQKENLVYLTADSETMLDELDPSKIYIVGGLVDRNRWKGITMKKAEEQMIQTAKLPIGTFLKMSGSQVLTVKQVIEILLKYVETRDWKTSFFQVIPQRKRFEASASTAADDDNSEERHEDMQENETYYQDTKRQCVDDSSEECREDMQDDEKYDRDTKRESVEP